MAKGTGTKAQVIALEQRLRNAQLNRTRQNLQAAKDQALTSARKGAQRAREAMSDVPGQVMAGGAIGSVAAGTIDTMMRPLAGGMLPVSTLAGAGAAVGTVMAPKKYRPFLAGVTVGLLAPVGNFVGAKIGTAINAVTA